MREIGTLDLVTLFSVLGCGLIAGAFFAFSTFVMKALGNLPPAHGIAAMQSINVAVINPWFLTPFLGTAATCVAILIVSFLRWHDPRASYWVAGSVFYLVGTFLVTSLRETIDWQPLLRPIRKPPGFGSRILLPGRLGTTCERSPRSRPRRHSPSHFFCERRRKPADALQVEVRVDPGASPGLRG